MKKSDIHPMPEYYDRYIKLVEDIELSDAFQESLREITMIDLDRLGSLKETTYAPGKWTINDILQHVIDAERIQSYRSLMYARREPNTPASFDSDLLALNAKADRRNIVDLVAELKSLRLATIAMFNSFDTETLLNRGISWKYEVSVLSMGFFLIGHQRHHLNVIEEKYIPLLVRT